MFAYNSHACSFFSHEMLLNVFSEKAEQAVEIFVHPADITQSGLSGRLSQRKWHLHGLSDQQRHSVKLHLQTHSRYAWQPARQPCHLEHSCRHFGSTLLPSLSSCCYSFHGLHLPSVVYASLRDVNTYLIYSIHYILFVTNL